MLRGGVSLRPSAGLVDMWELTRYRPEGMIFPANYRSVIRLDRTCGLSAGWRGYAGMGLVRGQGAV